MNRKIFLQNSLLLGGASLLPIDSVFSQSIQESGMDKLTDDQGNFIQQPLPYNKNFLEPFMDEETLHLHYTFHHGNAVKAANKYQSQIREALDLNSVDTVDYFTKKLSLQFSSHILHTIFWTNLSNKKNEPAGNLLKEIEKSFGSYDKLKVLISQISKSVDGNGWGILAYQPYSKKLCVLQCENHEKLTQWGCVPLLVIDVWEHAYYLKWKNNRGGFVDNLFSIINWDNARERLQTAIKLS
ncbi:MAG: superoxide dismutase [Bacteroidetes bacterium]|nr:superoxide dismutase [Bacteroidota bacterium]